MKTIIKITFACVAALALNTANAQNALEKRKVQKVQSTTSVKAQPVSVTTNQRQEQTIERTGTPSAGTLKQTSAGTPKTPAQMSNKPLVKRSASQKRVVTDTNSVK